jgi:hypothetical protein
MSDSVRQSLRGTLRGTCVAGFAAGALLLAAATPALATESGHGKSSGHSRSAEHGKSGDAKSAHGKPSGHSHGNADRDKAQQAKPQHTTKAEHATKAQHAKPAGQATAGHNPPGNNGTVKIDGPAYGDGVRNEAHVSCEFRIKFFGFDAGQRADVTLAGHAPTGPGVVVWQRRGVLISDDAAGGAGRDADAVLGPITTADLALAGIAPGPHGYHLRLTVDVLGAPGGGKHKVFWLEPCQTPAPVPATTPAAGGAGAAAPVIPGTAAATGVAATPATGAEAGAPAVLGESVTRAGSPVQGRSVIAGLPVTGARLLGIAAAGLLLLLGGIALVRLSRRHRSSTAS